jgi:hypothetical protein
LNAARTGWLRAATRREKGVCESEDEYNMKRQLPFPLLMAYNIALRNVIFLLAAL